MKKLPIYLLMTAITAVMIYPLLWLLGASFKSNSEIFSSVWFIPDSIDFNIWRSAWKTVTPYTMGHYFVNTFSIIIPKTIFAVASSIVVAYGFSRFDFPLKRLFSALLVIGMLMPAIVKIMPMFLLWRNIGFLDTYIPLVFPALLAEEGMFVFILIRFFDSIRCSLCSCRA